MINQYKINIPDIDQISYLVETSSTDDNLYDVFGLCDAALNLSRRGLTYGEALDYVKSKLVELIDNINETIDTINHDKEIDQA